MYVLSLTRSQVSTHLTHVNTPVYESSAGHLMPQVQSYTDITLQIQSILTYPQQTNF